MVDEQLGLDAEQPVKQLLVVQFFRLPERAASNIAHGEQTILGQFFGVAGSYPPEIGEGAMIPQQAAVAILIEHGDTHPVAIWRDVFGDDIHGDLAEVEIAADTGGGGDAGFLQYLQNDPHGKLAGGAAQGSQVVGGIDENLIDGIDMDILRGDMAKVNRIDAGAVCKILGHLGRGNDVIDGEGGILP